MKVAITGAHGTGKTTLARALAPTLVEAVIVPEVPRILAEQADDSHFFRRGQNSFSRQCLIMASQITTEAGLERQGAGTLVSDRTVIDHWAYTLALFPEQASEPEGSMWFDLVASWIPSYDVIIRLEPEFPPEDDGVREAGVDFQTTIARKICALYDILGVETHRVTGSVAHRRDSALKLIKT